MKLTIATLLLTASLMGGYYHKPIAVTPEPATWLLLAGGLGALVLLARRRRR